jgi:hypothetical protein
MNSLQYCWKQGAKYRPPKLSSEHLTEEDRTAFMDEVRRGLSAYLESLINDYPGYAPQIGIWYQACMQDLKKQVEDLP